MHACTYAFVHSDYCLLIKIIKRARTTKQIILQHNNNNNNNIKEKR